MLSKDFFKMIIMASLIAFPVAWWAVRFWLRDFTYRVDIGIWVFLIAELAALLLVAATIGVQAIRAAMVNPVKALRSE
jgi:putative ABC transport system permease protein